MDREAEVEKPLVRGEGSNPTPPARALIKEITLENFMSYEYARIPLKPGLNLICGPNGAGKSTILLGLSVALGQAYTERSRRLSDLIRWGKDTARVTLLIDNTPVKGKKPLPTYPSDLVRLSRYLRKDGTYWYEAEYRAVVKGDVERLLSALGINPDNMLIIMHQNMIEEFNVLPPQEKLRMVEDAVGFRSYRENILEAQERLKGLVSEEESVSSLLKGAEQTLGYWQAEFEKYRRRQELAKRRELLERELAWAQVIREERHHQSLKEDLERKNRRLGEIARKIEETRLKGEGVRGSLRDLNFENRGALARLVEWERERGYQEGAQKTLKSILEGFEEHRAKLRSLGNPIERAVLELAVRVEARFREVEDQLESLKEILPSLEGRIKEAQSQLAAIEEKISHAQEEYINLRVEEATLKLRKEDLEDEALRLLREMGEVEESIRRLLPNAEAKGSRMETQRTATEISEDVKVVAAHIASLGDVSEETEKMYRSYLDLYEDLKKKWEMVSENKRKALEEVELRKGVWRKALQGLLDEVNPTYTEILAIIGALGRIRLADLEDIETAGLEVSVGFRGVAPTVLNAYTQSGGERTTAIMALLLALQHHVKSPIRAVDEFDVHMDPHNRESVSRLISATVRGSGGAQYIVITPGQLQAVDEDAYIVMIQSVAGRSAVSIVG